jgi:hypothetical protein
MVTLLMRHVAYELKIFRSFCIDHHRACVMLHF